MANALDLYQGMLYQLDRYGAPSYEVADFNYWWSFATRKYIEKTLEVFDLTQKVTDGLRALVSNETLEYNVDDDDSETPETFVKFKVLPADYQRLLGVMVNFRVVTAFGCYKVNDIIKKPAHRYNADMAGFIEENTYHRPTIDRPYHQVKGDNLHIFYDTVAYPNSSVTIDTVDIEYIGQPISMVLPATFTAPDPMPTPNTWISQFSQDVNDSITKICVRLILENIENAQRLQTNMALDRN